MNTRRGFATLLTLVLLALSPATRASSGVVTALNLNTVGSSAELTVQVSGSSQPHLFTLTSPDRVVLDLTAARLGQSVAIPRSRSSGINAVRAAPHDANTLRIVLELTQPQPAQLSTLKDGAGQVRYTVHLGQAKPSAAGAVPAVAAVTARPGPLEPRVVRTLEGVGRPLIIAVDAGHGGDDPGASGKSGTHEKNVTLAVARTLAAKIDSQPGMRAVLTRDTDMFVPLRTRIVKAAQAQADIFVSIHADAIVDREVSGASVYVLSAHGASSEAARRLADRENAADLVGGVSLKDKDPLLASVLLDLSQSAAMSASEVLAEAVLKELDQVGEVRKSQVQRAGFLVLKSPDIPSLLVETAYITNPQEERGLTDPQHQAQIASAILNGIQNYLRAHPPAGVRLAAVTP